MGWFGSGRRPNVERLRRKEDLAGLKAAAGYRDRKRLPDGEIVDDGVPVRVSALKELLAFPADAIAETAHAALADEDPEVRTSAVVLTAQALEVGGDAALISGLASWPEPPFESARAAAVAAVAAGGAHDAAARYASQLAGSNELALSRERDEAVLAALLDGDGPGDARRALAQELVERLADPEESGPVRERAAAILEWMGGDAVAVVAPLLRAHTPDARVVDLTGRLADTELLADVVMLCEHPEPALRESAARAVGAMLDTRGVAALLRLTQDDVHAVRRAALTALDGFGVDRVLFGVSAGAGAARLRASSPLAAPRLPAGASGSADAPGSEAGGA